MRAMLAENASVPAVSRTSGDGNRDEAPAKGGEEGQLDVVVPKEGSKVVAQPKSEIRRVPFSKMRRFSGLMSRCATPRSCKYSRPWFV